MPDAINDLNTLKENLQGKVLLIVEDETDLREPLAEEFESLGCKVFQAQNGREGFEILKREGNVHAVISDIRMPGGDGIELLKNIKQLDYQFPVVMLITGFSDLSKEEAYHLGAEAILSKPFDLDEIDAAVAKILIPKELRWKPAASVEEIKHRLEKTFVNLDTAVSDGALGLGRGGLFIQFNARQPLVGQPLSFHIKFERGEILILEGTGVVRWARAEPEGNLARGCGIEFESLTPDAKKSVIKLTETLKTVPFIPISAYPK